MNDAENESSDDDMLADASVRIVMLGAPAVGKTTYCGVMAHGQFLAKTQSTIGVGDYQRHSVQVARNTITVPTELIDTAGEERFEALVNQYFRQGDGALIFFDASDARSLSAAVRRYKRLADLNERAVALFVGNKLDLLPADDAERSRACDALRDLLCRELGRAPALPLEFVSLKQQTLDGARPLLAKVVERVVLNRTAERTRDVAAQARADIYTPRSGAVEDRKRARIARELAGDRREARDRTRIRLREQHAARKEAALKAGRCGC